MNIFLIKNVHIINQHEVYSLKQKKKKKRARIRFDQLKPYRLANTPTMLTMIARTNIDHEKTRSLLLRPGDALRLNLSAIRAGKVNPNDTAVVAPVNLKAVHILGIMVDAIYISAKSAQVNPKHLVLLSVRGAEALKANASTVCLNEK